MNRHLEVQCEANFVVKLIKPPNIHWQSKNICFINSVLNAKCPVWVCYEWCLVIYTWKVWWMDFNEMSESLRNGLKQNQLISCLSRLCPTEKGKIQTIEDTVFFLPTTGLLIYFHFVRCERVLHAVKRHRHIWWTKIYFPFRQWTAKVAGVRLLNHFVMSAHPGLVCGLFFFCFIASFTVLLQ